jgi:hypothetical protein
LQTLGERPDLPKNPKTLRRTGIQDADDLYAAIIDGSLVMIDDPIVEEVHRIRRELAAKFDFDVDAILADIQTRQLIHGDRLVQPPPRDQVETELGSEAAESKRAG